MLHRLRQSMVYKVSILMSLALTCITTIIIGMVLSNGVLNVLIQQPSLSFTKEIETYRSIVKDQLMLGLGNITAYSTDIENIYNTALGDSAQLDAETTIDFLSKSAPLIINMLSYANTTGAFIILDNDGSSDEYTSFFLRDPTPDATLSAQKDFLIQFAPAELVEILGFDKMPIYKPNITLEGRHKNILNIPTDRELTYPNNKELGFWQVSPDFAKPDQSIITYSMPLVDNDGNVFGVIGMGITEEYLYSTLPEISLEHSSMIGYSLGTYDTYTSLLEPVLNYGQITESDIAPLGQPLNIKPFDESLQLYSVQDTNTDFTVISSIHYLNLYKDTPFEHKNWVFIGYTNQETLLDASTSLQTTLVITFISIISVGLFLSWLFAKKISAPITNLANIIGTSDTKTIHSLVNQKMGYSEIDILTKAIVHYSKKEKLASLKTDKIISMVNLPLGTFEHSNDNDYVICSPSLINLFDIPSDAVVDDKVNATTFFSKINNIKANVENETEGIYMLEGKITKWFKIVTVEDDNSILGICLDVSKDILEKHIRDYERNYDSLSRLLNREAFRNKVELIFQNKIEGHAAFVMFDIDNLKYINDTYGHDMGDYYISSIASVLSKSLSSKCIVGRMSGDEFYVFAQSPNSKDEIRNLLQVPYQIFDKNPIPLPDGKLFKMRISGGISWYGQDTYSLDELIQYADFAMYQGKHSTKGELREFDKAVYLQDSFILNGSEELNRILDNNLITFVYQPIVSAKTGEIYGYEALMRPQSKIIDTPLKLLKIATLQSKLYKIENITINTTFAAYSEHIELFNGCKLFINSVPNEIFDKNDLKILSEKYSDILKYLVIEITESEKLNMSISDKKIEFAKKHGLLVALDDYGSGYSSNLSLLSIKPDIVKIDKMMIKDISNDKNRQSMLQQILTYSKEKNIHVLAEGVETFEDMEYLINANIDFLQGYYISRPTPLPDYNTYRIKKEITAIHNG